MAAVIPIYNVIDAGGIVSGEGFGAPSVGPVIQPTGIAGGEAFGTAVLSYLISPQSVASSEAIGIATVYIPADIPSWEIYTVPARGRIKDILFTPDIFDVPDRRRIKYVPSERDVENDVEKKIIFEVYVHGRR
jgi:hypothetical protein